MSQRNCGKLYREGLEKCHKTFQVEIIENISIIFGNSVDNKVSKSTYQKHDETARKKKIKGDTL